MNNIKKAWCALCDITTYCGRNCVYCSRSDRHLGHTRRHMSLDDIDNALFCYKDFPNRIGIIGGEPLTHPEFTEICKLCQKHLPKEKLCIFTSLKVPKYDAIMQQTFGSIFYHEHNKEQEGNFPHQPLTIACKDVIKNPELRDALIDDCWLQRKWCPTVTVDGAFFCEVGASLAGMMGCIGWPVEPFWWDKDPAKFISLYWMRDNPPNWGNQLNLCQMCGMCVPMERQLMADKVEKISPSFIKMLKERNLPLGNYEPFLREITVDEMKTALPNWSPGFYSEKQIKTEGKYPWSTLDWSKIKR